MAEEIASFRDFYWDICDCKNDLFTGVMVPWQLRLGGMLQSLRALQEMPTSDVPDEDLWQLYALSRVLDFLILPFQATSPNDWWQRPGLTRDEFSTFFGRLGFTPFESAAGSPF